jgi:endonuclease III
MRRKDNFDLQEVLGRVEAAVEPFPPAALFVLADEGYESAFHILVACILSIRTRDETMLPAARALFARANGPEQILALKPREIEDLIHPCGFYPSKAVQIQDIARQVVEQHAGVLPCDEDVILSLKGVGPKCANLVLGIACGKGGIAVDAHVHRIVNRWGYVRTKTPEETMGRLEKKVPRELWLDVNRLLVPFGKHICAPIGPRCSICPVEPMCRQVGVKSHR